MTAPSPARSLAKQLEQNSIPYELIDQPRTTTAVAEARVLGVEPREVAKTVVLTTPDGFVRAPPTSSSRSSIRR